MIPAIGTMIGAYIFTRMIELLMNPKPNGEAGQRIFAILTILATIVCVLSLFSSAFMVDRAVGSSGLTLP
jgi:hypothetical protein